jgi:succinate dehydrogenase/fumarate reductase flavoprotein subunit
MFDYDPKGERATRDIVSRAMYRRCSRGAARRTAASISAWRIWGPTRWPRDFKGMVQRCRDCGFDLAGGDVEVVPTAHYMMGGIASAPTAAPRSTGSMWRARIPAVSTAPTGSAATASATPPCSAPSPATPWQPVAFTRVRPGESLLDEQRSGT